MVLEVVAGGGCIGILRRRLGSGRNHPESKRKKEILLEKEDKAVGQKWRSIGDSDTVRQMQG